MGNRAGSSPVTRTIWVTKLKCFVALFVSSILFVDCKMGKEKRRWAGKIPLGANFVKIFEKKVIGLYNKQ